MAGKLLTRAQLLDNFSVKARQHFDGDVPCSIESLLAELAALVPDTGLNNRLPGNRVWLTGEIETDMADDFLEELMDMHYYLPMEVPCEIILSSSGGEVDAGTAIATVLSDMRRDGRKIIIHVAGSAMSIAFDILQVADVRIAEPTAMLMTHHERFGIGEDDALKHVNDGTASINRAKLVFEQLSQRTGRPISYYLDKVKGIEWYITPEEALREGLIDEIAIARPYPITPARDNTKPAKPRKPRAPKTEDNNAGITGA